MKIINLKSWTLILLTTISLLGLILTNNLYSKKEKPDWRYEINGYVIHEGKQHPAIWYTDTIEIGDNYLRYQNSDGTEVIIPAPYVLIDHKYETIKKNNTKLIR